MTRERPSKDMRGTESGPDTNVFELRPKTRDVSQKRTLGTPSSSAEGARIEAVSILRGVGPPPHTYTPSPLVGKDLGRKKSILDLK